MLKIAKWDWCDIVQERVIFLDEVGKICGTKEMNCSCGNEYANLFLITSQGSKLRVKVFQQPCFCDGAHDSIHLCFDFFFVLSMAKAHLITQKGGHLGYLNLHSSLLPWRSFSKGSSLDARVVSRATIFKCHLQKGFQIDAVGKLWVHFGKIAKHHCLCVPRESNSIKIFSLVSQVMNCDLAVCKFDFIDYLFA